MIQSPLYNLLNKEPSNSNNSSYKRDASTCSTNSVRAYSPANPVYDLSYYLRSALSGGICCAITHGALCPVDVVKTRMQLDPVKYSGSLFSGFKKVIQQEGAGALATGLAPTAFGYFIQGWFKFGGVEFFKIQQANYFGERKAWEKRMPIYLASAAMAEFIADIFLCPLEAVRIKQVANKKYATGLLSAIPRIAKDEGVVRGFYSGFVPMLFKQVPYTMAKFTVQGFAAEQITSKAGIDMSTAKESVKFCVSLSSGVIAGVAAAIISHPADTLMSVINKPGAGGEGNIMVRLGRVAGEIGLVKLATNGLAARCVMIGTLTAGQFGIFDIVMHMAGASKFHFTDPNSLTNKH